MNVDWECLAFGQSVLSPLRGVKIARRLRSEGAYLRACFIYRRRGFSEVSDYLCYLKRCFRPLEIASTEEAVRLARREMVSLRILGRFVLEDFHCLSAAISLTAGLIALGLPAQVVVGKAKHYISPYFDFHAWTEIDGVPINDVPQTQKGFLILLKHPDWGASERLSPSSKMKGGDTAMTPEKRGEATKETRKLAYEKPIIEVIGRMEELTGSNGKDNDDGWGYDKCP